MDEFGGLLREARERKGLLIEDVEQSTRIRAKYLRALEAGEYEQLPTPVQVRGFLRTYAGFLGLDAQPLIDHYEATAAPRRPYTIEREPDEPISARSPIPSRPDNPFFRPGDVDLNPRQGTGPNIDSILRTIIIFALLAAIALVASRFFLDDGRTFSINEFFNTVIVRDEPASANDIDGQSVIATAEAEVETNNPNIVNTSRNALEEVNAEPTAVPDITTIDNLETISLRLDITERSWIQIIADDEVVYEGYPAAGDIIEQTAQRSLYLKTGNAFGIFATMNEIPLGKLGERAEVWENTWTTTGTSEATSGE